MTTETAVDLKHLNTLLVERMKVKRRPVAISYCADAPPPGYEPANVVACAIVREAEAGRRVYVDVPTALFGEMNGGRRDETTDRAATADDVEQPNKTQGIFI